MIVKQRKKWNNKAHFHAIKSCMYKIQISQLALHFNITSQGSWMQQSALAHGILLCPAPSSCLVLGPVCLIHMSNFRHQWIVWVWVRQEGTYGEQHLRKRTTTLPTNLKNSNDERDISELIPMSPLSNISGKHNFYSIWFQTTPWDNALFFC